MLLVAERHRPTSVVAGHSQQTAACVSDVYLVIPLVGLSAGDGIYCCTMHQCHDADFLFPVCVWHVSERSPLLDTGLNLLVDGIPSLVTGIFTDD